MIIIKNQIINKMLIKYFIGDYNSLNNNEFITKKYASII